MWTHKALQSEYLRSSLFLTLDVFHRILQDERLVSVLDEAAGRTQTTAEEPADHKSKISYDINPQPG